MIEASTCLKELVDAVDEAVSRPRPGVRVVEDVASVLQGFLGRDDLLDDELMQPRPGRYVRNLLYRDPAKRFAILGLVWASKQGTPIHDHDSWGIVGVHRGSVMEQRFDLVPQDADRSTLLKAGKSEGGVGATLAVDPPATNLHYVQNLLDDTSVTIHIYGSEMTHCHVYGTDGTITRKEMVYDLVTDLVD